MYTGTRGCKRILKEGQWWTWCGETDMGQTGPALCTECGGDLEFEKPERYMQGETLGDELERLRNDIKSGDIGCPILPPRCDAAKGEHSKDCYWSWAMNRIHEIERVQTRRDK